MNINKSREAIHAQDSNLAGSRFSNVNLVGTEFDNVNLQLATFNNVNLTDAAFSDINLTNARITDANTTGLTINGVPIPAAGRFGGVMPVLRVQDMQRAIDWYTQLIGLVLLWRSANEGGGENCMLRNGPVTLMLSTGTHLGGKPAFTGTLYFDTPAVAVFYEHLKDRVDMVWPLEQMPYGAVEFGIRDPDGYVLAFAERR